MHEVHLHEITGLLARNWKRLAAWALGGLLLVTVFSVFAVGRQWQATATLVLGNTNTTASQLSSLFSGVSGGALSALLPQQGPTTDLFGVILQDWDTRTRVVRENNLQKFWQDNHWQKSVERLADCSKIDANPPTSVAVTVTLKGTARGLINPEDADLPTRQLAVNCVNSYLKALTDALESVRVSSAKSQRVYLEAEVPKSKAAFDRANAALVGWEAAHHLLSPPKAADAITQKLLDIQTDLTTAQVDRVTQASAVARASTLLKGQPELVVSVTSQAANPEIERITAALALLDQQIAEQETFFHKTPQHPDVTRLLVQKQALIGQLQAAFQKQMLPAGLARARNQVHDQVLGQLLLADVTMTSDSAKIQGLSRVLAEAKRQVEGLTWASLDYAKLYEEQQLTQAIYETIVKQNEAAQLNEKAEEPVFFVVDPPVVPWKKSSPSYMLNAVLGLMLGLLLGGLRVMGYGGRVGEEATTGGGEDPGARR